MRLSWVPMLCFHLHSGPYEDKDREGLYSFGKSVLKLECKKASGFKRIKYTTDTLSLPYLGSKVGIANGLPLYFLTA